MTNGPLRLITIDATFKVDDFKFWTDGAGYLTRKAQSAFKAMDEGLSLTMSFSRWRSREVSQRTYRDAER